MSEENLSTQQYPAEKNPRVQETDVHQRGPAGPKKQEGQGKKETHRGSERILKTESP
jgi:hypothetical protein